MHGYCNVLTSGITLLVTSEVHMGLDASVVSPSLACLVDADHARGAQGT